MRPLTEQRDFDEETHMGDPGPPPRLGGTDVFRGAMVILLAVLIGAFVISRGLGETTGTTDAASDDVSATDSTDPASASATDDPSLGDEAGDGATVGTETEDPSATVDPVTGATGATVDPATGVAADPAATPTTAVPAATSSTTTPLATIRPPSEVRVLVLNGASAQGIAARGTEMLQAASYLTAAPKNADSRGPSMILHMEGYAAEALAVAQVFGPGLDTLVVPLDATNQPVDDLQGAAVVVVLGTDDAIPLT